MEVGLHFENYTLLCESAYLFLSHVAPIFQHRTESPMGEECFTIKYLKYLSIIQL